MASHRARPPRFARLQSFFADNCRAVEGASCPLLHPPQIESAACSVERRRSGARERRGRSRRRSPPDGSKIAPERPSTDGDRAVVLLWTRGRAGRSARARYARAISPPGAPASSATSRQARPLPPPSRGTFRSDAEFQRASRVSARAGRPTGAFREQLSISGARRLRP